MYCFKASTYLKLLKKHQPQLFALIKASIPDNCSPATIILKEKEFERCESISIDYALMEKCTNNIAMVTLDMRWSDIGNWESLYANIPESKTLEIKKIINQS